MTGLFLTPCLLQAGVDDGVEFQYGAIILGGSITTLFLTVVFVLLLLGNKIYRKKALVKIKRALENDID